jgi:hypothetical protein
LESSFLGWAMDKQFTKRTPQGTLVLCAGALAVWMGGCTTGETVSVNPSPAASPAAVATQSFSKPLVAEKKEDKVNPNRPIPGLLQSTDPAERARQVEAGINGKRLAKDPFLNLPSITTFKGVAPIKLSSSGATATGSSPANSSAPAPASLPAPVKVTPTKQVPSPISSLPPMPDPALAKAVEVTGVVVVAGVPQAIVQAPNEASSRYVQAGQRLSNGQVLVKRIEMHGSSDPVVILEQNGVEVSKTVGSPTSGSPTALLSREFFLG